MTTRVRVCSVIRSSSFVFYFSNSELEIKNVLTACNLLLTSKRARGRHFDSMPHVLQVAVLFNAETKKR